jgi:hypothetical protein
MSQLVGLSRLEPWVHREGARDREARIVRIFVAGGGGVLGRRLVPQLVPRGHLVTATTRPDTLAGQRLRR